MYLRAVEDRPKPGSSGDQQVRGLRKEGVEVPQILHLFAYKPEMARHLGELSEVIMRGPSPLNPGLRELIGAFTSARNRCVF